MKNLIGNSIVIICFVFTFVAVAVSIIGLAIFIKRKLTKQKGH